MKDEHGRSMSGRSSRDRRAAGSPCPSFFSLLTAVEWSLETERRTVAVARLYLHYTERRMRWQPVVEDMWASMYPRQLLLVVLAGFLFCNTSTSGCNCACTLVIHDNDAVRGDIAFRHLERRRDRAIGKQPLSNAQRYRIAHQPERIDQIMLDKRLNEITTSPNVQIRPLLLLDFGDFFCNISV